MQRMRSEFDNSDPPRSMIPLFWVHGEDERLLRDEIGKMDEGGMRGFIIESRVHTDYLGDGWWRDLGIIVDEAKRRRMDVWILDDRSFPSGHAAGIPVRENPSFAKLHIEERHIDVFGPVAHGCFDIAAWLAEGEYLVAAVIAQRMDVDTVDVGSLVDVTDLVGDGYLRYSVPDGRWRLFLIVGTRRGKGSIAGQFVDALRPEAVDRYIEVVFEATYRALGGEFGDTIKGFFTDEPQFANAASHYSLPGQADQVLPYYEGLLADMAGQVGCDARRLLPLLWYQGPDGPDALTSALRHDYMESVTTRYANSFFQRIGEWCRRHGVRWIGHIVEDNGSHGRLGYGGGHYFKDMAHLDAAGIDVVFYQLWPGVTDGMMNSPFVPLDMGFFHWGLAKMASSATHLDPRKAGMTVCEAYGAYGWREGLRSMKWLTDHLCVRGVNVIVPHAFSPRFPDPDSPPHFWARGHNPQWPLFRYFSNYVNRTCHLLSGGVHIAEVAVLYTATSLWAGSGDEFEKAVRMLAEGQIDCDVVPYRSLEDAVSSVHNGRLHVNNECFRAVVLPRVEAIPIHVLGRLADLAQAGIPVYVIEEWPDRPCSTDAASTSGFPKALSDLKQAGLLCKYAELVSCLRRAGLNDFTTGEPVPCLRHLHYRKDGADIYFLFNEHLRQVVDTWVTLTQGGSPEYWDPLTGKQRAAQYERSRDNCRIRVQLAPYESVFVVFPAGEVPEVDCGPGRSASEPSQTAGKDLPGAASAHASIPIAPNLTPESHLPGGESGRPASPARELCGPWVASVASAEEYPSFREAPDFGGPGDWSVRPAWSRFAGTVRYETDFCLPQSAQPEGEAVLDLGEVFELARVEVNGRDAGVRIAPPYIFSLEGLLRPGVNHLAVEVTNTLARCPPVPDSLSRYVSLDPCGLLGPVRLVGLPA